MTHRPTQKEIFSRYPQLENQLAFGRIKIIHQALYYKTHTLRAQEIDDQGRYNLIFTEQGYLDAACVADQNRPIAVDYSSLTVEKTVVVTISSYKVPKETTLRELVDDKTKRQKLERQVRRVKADINWLKSTCRVDIAQLIDEEVFGTKVMRVRGENVGSDDPQTLSFSGSVERVEGFLPLPQGQRIVHYDPPYRKEADGQEIWYDSQSRATDPLRKLQKDLHSKFDIPYAPPPPTDTTQIVKLKWLPSNKPGAKGGDGIWHGLFAICLGVSKTNTTLQECSLTQEWVATVFSVGFRRECEVIAERATHKRNDSRYLYIPSGDVRNTSDDLPPLCELLSEVSVHYQQGDLDTCLRHSMSSAFHAMGFTKQAQDLAVEVALSGDLVGLLESTLQCVNKLFSDSRLRLMKVFTGSSLVDKVTQEDPSWPMVLILKTSEGECGSHAITTWNGMIFDSNLPTALRWSQASLDWCSGKESTCIGFSKVYRLCPANYGQKSLNSTLQVGTQIRSKNGLGWVKCLPIFGGNGQQKRGYIVRYIHGVEAEMGRKKVSKYVVKK